MTASTTALFLTVALGVAFLTVAVTIARRRRRRLHRNLMAKLASAGLSALVSFLSESWYA
jgi:hypothetical protein